MSRTLAAWSVLAALGLFAPEARAVQFDAAAELAAFQKGVEHYAEMHRRLEGPVPPRTASADMSEVQRLMEKLRERIRAERHQQPQGPLVTDGMALLLRGIIARTLTVDDIVELAAELEEHTPAGMRMPTVNEALPDAAPFVLIAPQLIRALPPLPLELRYVALGHALLIWDRHANLVVEVVPGLFDPRTYPTKKSDEGEP